MTDNRFPPTPGIKKALARLERADPIFTRMSRQRLEAESHGLQPAPERSKPGANEAWLESIGAKRMDLNEPWDAQEARTARIRVELDLADLRLLDIALSVLETPAASSLRARLTAARDNLDR